MLIELAVVGDDVAVVVGVTDSDSSVLIYLYVVVAVSYVKFLEASLGLDRPMEGAVLFRNGNDPYYMRNEIVIVKAVLNGLS